MEYNFKFINGNRLFAIGLPGVLLSFIFPPFLKARFAIDDAWMFGLMATLLVSSCLIAYFKSKRKEYFLIADDGLHTSRHGLVRWNEVEGLKMVDSPDHEILTIRFEHKEKISIPSKVIGDPDRQTFIMFKEEIERRLLEAHGPDYEPAQRAYAFSGKGYRLIGYILLLSLFLFTPYVLYLVAVGEMTAGKLVSVLVAYLGILPVLGSIFREELFGKRK